MSRRSTYLVSVDLTGRILRFWRKRARRTWASSGRSPSGRLTRRFRSPRAERHDAQRLARLGRHGLSARHQIGLVSNLESTPSIGGVGDAPPALRQLRTGQGRRGFHPEAELAEEILGRAVGIAEAVVRPDHKERFLGGLKRSGQVEEVDGIVETNTRIACVP